MHKRYVISKKVKYMDYVIIKKMNEVIEGLMSINSKIDTDI